MAYSRRIAIVAVLSALLPVIAHAVDLTACGQLVPSGETGVLQADLSCAVPVLGCYHCPNGNCFPSGASCTVDADCAPPDARCAALPGVAIEFNGTLDMNGHSIAAPGSGAVVCRSKGRCTVTSTTGRGDVSGSEVGVMMRAGKLRVSHVDVHDNGAGIYSPLLATEMTLTDVTANDNGAVGIRCAGLRANGVTANGNGQHGIEANGNVKGTSVTTNGNAWAGTVANKGVKLTGFTSIGNGTGGERYAGAGLVAAAGGVKLSTATVTGNTFDDGSGPRPLDTITRAKPRLTAATCDHSARIDRRTGVLGAPWGVCTAD